MTEPMTMTAEEARKEADLCDPRTSDPKDKRVAATLRAYADMLEREARVKVKPLVWEDHTGLSVARLKCGLNYGVFPVADGKSFSVYLEGLPCEESDDSVCMWSKDLSGNIEDAKTAAREHYEAAILAAIEGAQP